MFFQDHFKKQVVYDIWSLEFECEDEFLIQNTSLTLRIDNKLIKHIILE